MTKCDYCDKESVGYVSRQFQGPFYCEEHQERAETETNQYMKYLEDERMAGEDYPGDRDTI